MGDKRPFIPQWYRRGAAGRTLSKRDQLSIYKCPPARLLVYQNRLRAEQQATKRAAVARVNRAQLRRVEP